MVLNTRMVIALATMIAIGVVMVGGVFAATNASTGTKPGWGYGDKNHVHTGPPGQSVRPAK